MRRPRTHPAANLFPDTPSKLVRKHWRFSRPAEATKTLNIPVYTARDWHRSFLIGTFRAEHGARQQSYTPEQKAEVLRLRKEEGKSYNVISQLTKVNRATVLQWIHKDIAQQQAAEAAAQQAPANDSEMTETGPVGAVAEMTTSGPTA